MHGQREQDRLGARHLADDILASEPVACSCQLKGSTHEPLSQMLSVEAIPGGRVEWRKGLLSTADADKVATVACAVADMAMRWRCRGAPRSYILWRDAINSGAHLPPSDQRVVTPFFQTVFGIPAREKPIAHMCGWIAELLWYRITLDLDLPQRLVRHIEGPDFHATSPGGDGLVVWQNPDGGLVFHLWEIKNYVGQGSISSTVRDAYEQLTERATEYLAKMTAIATAAGIDDDLVDILGNLVALWADDDERCGAGVSVTTHADALPSKCFTTMHKHFPGKQIPGQLEGLVTAVANFEHFAVDVRSRVWRAL